MVWCGALHPIPTSTSDAASTASSRVVLRSSNEIGDFREPCDPLMSSPDLFVDRLNSKILQEVPTYRVGRENRRFSLAV